MSKINAVRLININYNNNAIRISDECFHFHGDSTLISLRNGGGKSVLVQMMTAPFVRKRYRDTKDRPFESYFTTNKPSFILVEWVLDQNAGYVLTGMMVRRRQEMDQENNEALDMVNIISEYRKPCIQDIHHLAVVEKGAKEIVLKNYNACKQMFEMYKKDASMQFYYYDMSNSAQSRQYFDKLQEYQINYKEWESIIKKVNQKESGLSELFADCKDEKGLVEKWFLEAVESKVNRERNRMKEFQSIIEKYVGQYKDNQSKIKRRDIIRMFKEESVRIREKAEAYAQEEKQEQKQMHLLARFIEKLNGLKDLSSKEHQEVLEQLDAILQEIARIEYEKISGEIHKLEEKLRNRISNRDMLEMEKDNLQKEADIIEHKLHLFACAKQRDLCMEEKQELEIIRQKIRRFHQEDQELEPERIALGGKLLGYYSHALVENDKRQKENQKQDVQMSKQADEEKKKLAELEQEIRTKASEEGALKSKVEGYDQQEERYNTSYKAQLIRNILGEYEPATLDILGKSYEKELEACTRERQRKKKQQEHDLEQQKSLERALEELRIDQTKKQIELRQQEQLKQDYDKELEARKAVLKYLDLDATQSLFDKERILRASERKLQEIAGNQRKLEKEEDALQKEYLQLTQGKTLELPEPLEAEFQNMGLTVVYGMEWLKKNKFTEEENRKLVHYHPFLPYALILSAKELEKLEQNIGEVYTSFPIPIILREQLEKKTEEHEGNIFRMQNIRFYMLFNENLLNEEKLRLLVEEKVQQIKKKQEAIEIRQTEYKEYFERQELVKNQSVSEERYRENDRQMEALKAELLELEGKLQSKKAELENLRQELKALERELREAEKTLERYQRRQEDFGNLCKSYKQYEQNRLELEQCRRRIARLEDQKSLAQSSLEKLQEQIKTLKTQANCLEQEQLNLKARQQRYLKYETVKEASDSGEILTEEIASEVEARYTAITGQLSQDRKELEEREQRLAKRYEDAVEYLEVMRTRYQLKKEEWKDVSYDQKEELHQEVLQEDYKKKIKIKEGLCIEEVAMIASLQQQKKDRIQRMAEVCGKEEPLPKSEIQDQDFDARKNQLQYQIQEAKKRRAALEEQLRSYEENLTALAEYNEFPLGELVEWKEDFASMDKEALRDYQGILVRDYKQMVQNVNKARERLDRELNIIVRMEAFQEDFYRKPLESMLAITDDSGQVLQQLTTTIQSYDSLMEKLEVDISVVEKEKQRIAELLGDYIQEVHQNLGRIDANSTITIRERPVKMLKLQLPAWEENENLYHIRIQDLIDELTQKGLGILEQNENALEYLGTKLTTKNLYNTVIGIGNVQIRLYKIEEQREYPITWAEVARNSGGEGFLSAFVILSSLLYYMRKDESDIFADRNEGKVLLMDNPFAQTNASHLLKPLMDMAKKTNTQLICLTGLGGESIYNRFDNIYVLNLIAASLRSGMQYLKANHLRGNEPETMIASQIEVMEQQELIF